MKTNIWTSKWWSLWAGGRFLEVVVSSGLTASSSSCNSVLDITIFEINNNFSLEARLLEG